MMQWHQFNTPTASIDNSSMHGLFEMAETVITEKRDEWGVVLLCDGDDVVETSDSFRLQT